jgi:hypothetical protein
MFEIMGWLWSQVGLKLHKSISLLDPLPEDNGN